MTTLRRLKPFSLHTRIGMVLTVLAAILMTTLGVLWVRQTREATHEEVTAAARVAEQWLTVSAAELRAQPSNANRARLLAQIVAVGRIRANALEVIDAGRSWRYLSPPPTYKAGRSAPAWFAALVEPAFAAWRIEAAGLTLVLHPDPSRATLDAWDNLCAMAGWAVVLLSALFIAVRHALEHALRPLGQIMTALDRTGAGCFDTRLPAFPIPELGRLAKAFNGMADRLAQAVDHNVRLESERELDEQVHARLEAERRHIARELHDELAQGITAVRALAGAIAQRTDEHSALRRPAESIIAATNQMQDGVRTILHRLRDAPAPAPGASGTEAALRHYLRIWQQHYPDIALTATFAQNAMPIGEAVLHAILRIVQEGLTNVARHACATCVDVTLRRSGNGKWLELVVADNGGGLAVASRTAGSGLGLAGMRERVRTLGGEFVFEPGTSGGARLGVRLPVIDPAPLEHRS